jgi:hypothetical protein
VVLDTCSDATAELATVAGVMTLAIQAQNVASLTTGAEKMITAGATGWPSPHADSVVAPDWLAQLHLGADAVCARWLWINGRLRGKMKRHFALTYRH